MGSTLCIRYQWPAEMGSSDDFVLFHVWWLGRHRIFVLVRSCYCQKRTQTYYYCHYSVNYFLGRIRIRVHDKSCDFRSYREYYLHLQNGLSPDRHYRPVIQLVFEKESSGPRLVYYGFSLLHHGFSSGQLSADG